MPWLAAFYILITLWPSSKCILLISFFFSLRLVKSCGDMAGLKILSPFPSMLNIEDHIMAVNHSESMMLELIASSQSISISVIQDTKYHTEGQGSNCVFESRIVNYCFLSVNLHLSHRGHRLQSTILKVRGQMVDLS